MSALHTLAEFSGYIEDRVIQKALKSRKRRRQACAKKVPMRGLKKVLMNTSYLSRSGLPDPLKAEPLTVIVIKITQRKQNENAPNDAINVHEYDVKPELLNKFV